MLDGGEMGSEAERDEISGLEKDLPGLMSPQDELDGHEYGDGEAIIYIYGASADAIFASIESRLRDLPFDHIDITLQYGRPEDPKTQDKTFTM